MLYGRRQITNVPRHVGLVMDGNRRWAREQGFDNPSVGHRYGVEHIETVLGWCAELGIGEVTIYVASADNVRKRESPQVAYYMELIEEIIAGRLVSSSPLWRLRVAGRLDELPDSTAHALVAVAAGRTAFLRRLLAGLPPRRLPARPACLLGSMRLIERARLSSRRRHR